MGLLSIFQRQAAAAPASAEGGPVASARARARRRLIGAVVLVAAGVIGFSLLFDTAPRPVSADIPIEIPRKEGQPPLVAPPPKPVAAASSVTPPPAEDKPAERKAEPVPDKPVTTAKSSAKATEKGSDAARAQATLEGRAPLAKLEVAGAETPGRFVVQVGAFSEADSAREARARVEKLGLKTYTQVVETPAGKRIRVRLGPYGDRAEAEKAAAQLKQAGLSPAVMTL